MNREIKKPKIAVTAGDPAGIGTEVILKALLRDDIHAMCRPLVIGTYDLVERTRKTLSVRDTISLRPVPSPGHVDFVRGRINILDIPSSHPEEIEFGKVSCEAGRLAVCYVEDAIDLALKKEVDAVVTAPLCKESINLAGYRYQGHTEIFAKKTGVKNFAMMLATEKLRVIHVSLHVSLAEALTMVKKSRILDTILLGNNIMKDIGIKDPRILVVGLNPHAGEGGLFGKEEREEIIPAIQAAAEKGLNVSGPLSPDVAFHKAAGGEYDLVVAMYHDQGHIAIKTTAFDEGVNITIGLPIIRTSVGHGTAFDIAGRDLARPDSLIHALKLACLMAVNR